LTSPPNPQANQEEKQLSKVSYYEPGKLFVDSFEYDAQHRCTRLVKIWIDSSFNSDAYVTYYRFHYNGDEKKPFRITDTSEGRRTNWLILYDTQGRKTVDSIDYFVSGQKQITHYNYTGGMIISQTSYIRGSDNRIEKDTFDFVGGNCARSKAIMEYPTSNYWWQYTFTFDSHVNPLNKLNIANSVLFGAGTTLTDFRGFSTNNIRTSAFANSNDLSGSLSTFHYEYDAEEYPISAIIQGNGSVMVKYDYRYK